MKRFVVLVAILALVIPLSAQAGSDHSFGQSKDTVCGDDGIINYSPTALWPPNHKLTNLTFHYFDPDGGTELTIISKFHSDVIGEGEEATERNGSGNTPFATDSSGGTATDEADGTEDGHAYVAGTARAERSGRAINGRTYSFEYRAESDPDGMPMTGDEDGCESDPDDDSDDLLVKVPHDCREGNCKG